MRRIRGLYGQRAHARRVAGGQLLHVVQATLRQRARGAAWRQDAHLGAEPLERGDVQVIAVQVRKQHSVDRSAPLDMRERRPAA